MRLDASQLAFLGRLGKSPDGQQLLALISAEIAECDSALRKLSGKGLLREQGKAVYLDEMKKRLMPLPATASSMPRPLTQESFGR